MSEELREIQRQINNLKQEERALIRQEEEEFCKKAKEYVGKCYRSNKNPNKCFKIIDVPQRTWTMTGSNFNQYQFPACLVNKDENEEVPIEIDTVYYNIEYPNPTKTLSPHDLGATEISNEEFERFYIEVMAEFNDKILQAGECR